MYIYVFFQVLKENMALKQRRLACLRVTVQWLDELDIPYWLSDGTLLGIFAACHCFSRNQHSSNWIQMLYFANEKNKSCN